MAERKTRPKEGECPLCGQTMPISMLVEHADRCAAQMEPAGASASSSSSSSSASAGSSRPSGKRKVARAWPASTRAPLSSLPTDDPLTTEVNGADVAAHQCPPQLLEQVRRFDAVVATTLMGDLRSYTGKRVTKARKPLSLQAAAEREEALRLAQVRRQQMSQAAAAAAVPAPVAPAAPFPRGGALPAMAGMAALQAPAFAPTYVPVEASSALNADQTRLRDENEARLFLAKIHKETCPDTAAVFVRMLRCYEAGELDTWAVVGHVREILKEHPHLMQRFTMFLPPGYSMEAYSAQTLVLPALNRDVSHTAARGRQLQPKVIARAASRSHETTEPPAIDVCAAREFLQKVHTRMLFEPHKYKELLRVILACHLADNPAEIVREVHACATRIFDHHADLLLEFQTFLPPPTGSEDILVTTSPMER